MTGEQLERLSTLSKNIQDVMDAEPDFTVLHEVMAAHIQRMICDQAKNRPDESLELADKFHQHCLGKIQRITAMAYPDHKRGV